MTAYIAPTVSNQTTIMAPTVNSNQTVQIQASTTQNNQPQVQNFQISFL